MNPFLTNSSRAPPPPPPPLVDSSLEGVGSSGYLIYMAIRKVLFLGILDQRSSKGLILDVTEFFKILDKFSFKVITILSQISKLMILDSRVHFRSLIKPFVKIVFI